MTSEEYQEAINLTPEQEKAFQALKRAVARCNKANVYFYQCLSTLGALNGNNVNRVVLLDDQCGVPRCLQFMEYPTVETECSFADDNHSIELHGEHLT